MSIFCFLGRHKPSYQSISRGKPGSYRALCTRCGCPIERGAKGPWRGAEAVLVRPDRID